MGPEHIGGSPEVNTDPRYIYQNDSAVIAYRLGIVETDLKSLDVKLDRVINEYPTTTMLKLLIDPLAEKIKELEDEKKTEAAEKVKHVQQMKYMTYTAVIGPIATFAITLIMGFIFGVLPSGQPS